MMLVPISKPLQRALEKMSQAKGEPISQLVADILSHGLGVPLHTLFQVSTSGALVQGIYERAVSSTFLLDYGDFGIGTINNLDGEMVVLDGASIKHAAMAPLTRSSTTQERPSPLL
jgi:acetolactate decarboxylase